MSYLLDLENAAGNAEFTSLDALTDHERALLGAWDEANRDGQDDDGFKRRLLAACDHADALPLSMLKARDRRTWLQMTADGDDEHGCEARDRTAWQGVPRAYGEPARSDAGFHDTVLEHAPYLRGLALRLSGSRDSAQDLVQDTFARALRHFGEFQPGTNVRAWLARILTRLFLDQRKHEQVINKAAPQLAALEVVASDLHEPGPAVTDAVLWDAVKALDADLREVIELRYLQQLSYKEISDRLQLAVGTVGTRLMRAHERLKDLLGRQAA